MGGLGSGPKPRYSVQQVREALRVTGGNVSAAARVLGCDRKTVWNYLHRNTQRKKG